jgi:hypothetical protein
MPLDGHRGHGGVAGWRVGFLATAIIGGARRAEIDMRDIRSYPKLGRLVVRPFAFAFSTGHRHHHVTGLGACMLLLNPRIRRRRSRSICPSPNQSRFAAEKRSRGPSTCQAINCREPLTKSCQVPHCHHLHILVLASSLAKASRAASIPPLVLVPSPYTSPPYWFWYLCCYIYHGRCPGRQHALGPSSGGAHGSGGQPATGVPRGNRRIVMSWRWVGKVARASSRPVHPVPLPCVHRHRHRHRHRHQHRTARRQSAARRRRACPLRLPALVL